MKFQRVELSPWNQLKAMAGVLLALALLAKWLFFWEPPAGSLAERLGGWFGYIIITWAVMVLVREPIQERWRKYREAQAAEERAE